MLDRVKAELLSDLKANQDLLNVIKKKLDTYSSEVMDLRDAMNEAVNKTSETEGLNSLNYNNLEENKVQDETPNDEQQLHVSFVIHHMLERLHFIVAA